MADCGHNALAEVLPSGFRTLTRVRICGIAMLVVSGLLAVLVGGDRLLSAREEPRRLVLISLDTVAATHLALFGGNVDTPNLARLANRGVVAENAFTPIGFTLPAHISVWSGLDPLSHRVLDESKALASETATLPELLTARGFRSAAFTGGGFLAGRHGFARGFEQYVESDHVNAGCGDYESYRSQMFDWLNTQDRNASFLFVHTYTAHAPYGCDLTAHQDDVATRGIPLERRNAIRAETFPGVLRQQMTPLEITYLRDLYDAKLRHTDGFVGEILDDLESRGILSSTLVVVFSDHGEEFGEHGAMAHGRGGHAEIARVPLILAGPGLPAGRRVTTAISLTDLFPTILEGLGMDTPAGLDGSSMWSLFTGSTPEQPERVVVTRSGDHGVLGGRSARWSVVLSAQTSTSQLYDASNDRAELHDVAAVRPQLVTTMVEALRDRERSGQHRLTSHPKPLAIGAPSSEETEKLRALGYLH